MRDNRYVINLFHVSAFSLTLVTVASDMGWHMRTNSSYEYCICGLLYLSYLRPPAPALRYAPHRIYWRTKPASRSTGGSIARSTPPKPRPA